TLSFQAAKAFVTAVAASEIMKAAQGRYDRSKADLDDAQARVDAQLTSSNDATRQKVAVATASKAVVTSKRDYENALLNLGVIVGQEVKGPLESPDALSQIADSYEGKADELSKTATQNRGDL